MFKKIFSLISVTALVLTLGAFSVSAEDGEGPEANRDAYAYAVNGGTVNNVDELIAAFTDAREGNGTVYAQKVNGKENTVCLTENVVLKKPIIIASGEYTLVGANCTVYRGSDYDALFVLDGYKEGISASLTIRENITLDGMCDKYKADSSLVMVFGSGVFAAEDAEFVYAESYSEYGGAICGKATATDDEQHLALAPDITLKNCRFSHCKSGNGGAIALIEVKDTDAGDLKITDCVFEYNSTIDGESYAGGGAIYCTTGGAVIKSTGFRFNSADNGGAIYSDMVIEIADSSFEYNTAKNNGGAIYAKGGGTLSNSIITSNTAAVNGGAIFGDGVLTLKASYITENRAEVNGGAIYSVGKVVLNDGNINLNAAGKLGGGVYVSGLAATFEMTDGEMVANKAQYCGALWCDGDFNFLGGAIGNTESEFPQLLVFGKVTVAKDSFVKDDILGLGVKEKDGEKVYQPIVLNDAPNIKEPFNVAYVEVETDKDGNIESIKNATKGGVFLFEGTPEAIKSAADIYAVKSRGLLSYKISNIGDLSVRFIFLPVWVWLLIALLAVCAVGFIVIKKKGVCKKSKAKKN